MGRRGAWIAGATVVLAYLALALVLREPAQGALAAHEALYRGPAHPNVEDLYDRLAYQQRGRWIASGGRPYLDEFSEYPQLTTWLMGLPYLAFDHGVERGEPFGAVHRARELLRSGGVSDKDAQYVVPLPPAKPPGDREVFETLSRYPGLLIAPVRDVLAEVEEATVRRNAELVRNAPAYGDRHHVLMACWYLALLALVGANLRLLGESPAWSLLLVLPASLYFGLNRFDVVVTTVVALAIHLQLRGRTRAAALALGVAIMVKWAPIAILPLFLSHNVRTLRSGAASWPAALLRGAVVPGALAGGVIAALLGVTYVWGGGGVEAVRSVFDWHANVRQPNHSSFLALLTNPERWGWFDASQRPALERAFKLMQLAPGFLLAFLPLRTPRALLLGCLTATTFSIAFSEFFSPQWVMWITALGLYLAPRHKVLLALIFALELVMYLQLPVLWYRAQETGEAGAFWTVSSVRMALLLVMIATALALFTRELLRGRDPVEASPG